MKALPDQTMPVNSLAFSPDGSTLAIGGGDVGVLGPGNDGSKATGEFS